MIVALIWCAYTARGTPEYLPIARSWFAAELSMSGQDGGCKQRGQPAMISLKTRCLCPDYRFAVAIYIGTGLTGPYSAIQWRCQCSAELGWPSHSMCSSPHWQVGQSWFREKLSLANREQRLSRWADFAKNCLPRIGSKVLPRFREKYRALGRQKNGVQHATAIYPIPRYTRPRYIGLTLYWPPKPEYHFSNMKRVNTVLHKRCS